MDRGEMIKPLHGLRGIAAMMVLVHHLAPVDYQGAQGVTLFFVLSGFLLGKIYLAREFTALEAWRYASARFARIYPLFALVVISAGLLNLALDLDIFGMRSWQIDRHLLLLGENMTVWTIAVESHFYILFILAWMAASRGWLSRGTLVLLYLALAIGPFFFLGRIDPLRYLHIFAIGLLVANLSRMHSAIIQKASSAVLPIAFIAFLLVGLTTLDAYRDPAVPLLAGLVVYTSVQAAGSAPGRVLSLPVMVWLGEISFGLYLLHRFVQEFLVTYAGLPSAGWPTFVIGTAGTALLATLVFRFYEDPMRQLLRGIAQRLEQRFTGTARA
jgi:peptidoglycan/LPS O-acetylase OafA/YrhL